MSGWAVAPLLEVCRAYQPQTIGRNEMADGGPYTVYGANGIIGSYHQFNHEESEVLLGCRGSCGSVNVSAPQSWITGNAMVIKPRDDRLTKEFLRYFLIGSGDIARTITGVAQPQITQKSLAAVSIPLPPVENQRRIVAVLDEAFAAIDTVIANTEKNLASVHELFDNYSEEAFAAANCDWLEASLSELCEVITDGTHQTPRYYESGFVFLSSRNVTSKRIDWTNIKYIDRAQHEAMQRRLSPRLGDILLAKNGTTGVAAMVDRDIPVDIYVSLALLRPKPTIFGEFLLHFVNSPVAKRQFNSRLKGSGVPNLHLKEIREVRMRFPASLDLQTRFCADFRRFSSRIDAVRESYLAKLDRLAALKQSLLRRAFSGELTGRESLAA